MPITIKTTVEKAIETQEDYVALLKQKVDPERSAAKRGDFLKIIDDSNYSRFFIGGVVIAVRDADDDGDVYAAGAKTSGGVDTAFVEHSDYEVITEAEALTLPLPPAH